MFLCMNQSTENLPVQEENEVSVPSEDMALEPDQKADIDKIVERYYNEVNGSEIFGEQKPVEEKKGVHNEGAIQTEPQIEVNEPSKEILDNADSKASSRGSFSESAKDRNFGNIFVFCVHL